MQALQSMISMMTNHKTIFIDSSAWISYIVISDSNHEKAATIFSSINTKSNLFISVFIISETITKIRKILGQKKADALYKQFQILEKKKRLTILAINRSIIEKGIALLQKYPTPNTLSLTDATNIVLCEQFAIPTLFSFDRDFKKLKIPHLTILP